MAPAEKGRIRTERGKIGKENTMNGLTEQDYAEAFGVELPDEGGTADGTQEPVENGTGGTGEESAAQEQGTEVHEDGGATDEAGGAEMPGAEAVQSTEERSRQAYGRRAREREAERQALTAAAQARVDAVYADLFAGQTNPYTGQPIRTEADFRTYQKAKAKQEREAQILSAGVDPAALQGMVDDAVKPLREQVQRQRLEGMSAEARNVTAQAQAAIRRGLEAVRVKYDGSVQSLEDIVAMPTGAAFRDYVERGLSIEDAFYMANRDAVDKRRMEAAKQAGIKQASGKRHMAPVPGAAGEAPYVATPRQKELYREINPNATDDEINAAYGEFYKQ